MVIEPPEGCRDTDQVDPSTSFSNTSTGCTPKTTSVAALEGRRIVDIGHFVQSLQDSSRHEPFGCTFADMAFVSERRHGLHSSFTFKCRMCSRVDVIESEPRPEKDSRLMDVNSAAVSGVLSVGAGFSNLSELLAALNIPCMASGTFASKEGPLIDVIELAAWQSMKEAGVEEARMARECGEVDGEGYPLITVIADGAWSKRSYKNKYDASSGVVSDNLAFYFDPSSLSTPTGVHALLLFS
ncbi:unnamed protein product, partial [Ixodes persulcatus]